MRAIRDTVVTVAGTVLLALPSTTLWTAPATALAAEGTRLTALGISPSTVTASGFATAPVTVSAHLVDPAGLVTLDDLEPTPVPVMFLEKTSGPSDQGAITRASAVLHLTSGTAQDGDWSAVLAAPSTWDGVWRVSGLLVVNEAGDRARIDPQASGFSPLLTVLGRRRPLVTAAAATLVGNQTTTTLTGRIRDADTGVALPRVAVGWGSSESGSCPPSRTTTVTDAAGVYRFAGVVWAGGSLCVGSPIPSTMGAGPLLLAYLQPPVQPLIAARGPGTPVAVGTHVALTGNVVPLFALRCASCAGGRRPLVLQHWARGGWRSIGLVNVRASGRYTAVVVPRYPGLHRYRLILGGLGNVLPARSAIVLLAAFSSTPTALRASA